MMKKRKRLKGILAAALLTFVYLFIFHAPLWLNPNQILLNTQHDGIKNYYTYAYHVKWDSTFWHFQGMNYPYGEVVIFMDAFPLLANTVKVLAKFFPAVTTFSIGIMNLVLLSSFVIGAIFLCDILMLLGVAWWYAALAAMAIMVLSPQILRLEAHYALAIGWYLPLLLWLHLQLLQHSKWYFHLLLGIYLFLTFFCHPYVGAMMVFFNLLSIAFLYQWKEKVGVLLTTLLPAILFLLWSHSIDNHPDRVAIPWGLTAYRANFETLLFSRFSPFTPVYNKLMQFIGITISNEEAEGNGYLGLWSNIALASMAVQMVRKRRWLFNKLLFHWSIIALIAFCTASMFWFWNYPPGIQYIPFVAQLRSIGRFVWITYYILLILVFYWSYQQNKPWILVLSLILPLYESSAYQNYIKNNYKELKNGFMDYPIAQEVYNYLPRSQAALALPFYHFSNEILWFIAPNEVLEQSMLFSYRTGLPLINCMGSRTSWKESIAIYDLFSTADDKPALDKFLPSKGILCLHITSAPLREREKKLLEKGIKIAQSAQVHYYFLPLDSLKFLDFGDTLPSNRIAQFSFEEHPTFKVYRGRGALKADKNPAFIGQLRSAKKPTKARLYAWFYWKNIRTFFPHLLVRSKKSFDCFWEYAYYRDGDWVLLRSTPFIIEDTVTTFYLRAESLRWQTFYLDEAFIVKED